MFLLFLTALLIIVYVSSLFSLMNYLDGNSMGVSTPSPVVTGILMVVCIPVLFVLL